MDVYLIRHVCQGHILHSKTSPHEAGNEARSVDVAALSYTWWSKMRVGDKYQPTERGGKTKRGEPNRKVKGNQ
jgi:hypothetical protein